MAGDSSYLGSHPGLNSALTKTASGDNQKSESFAGSSGGMLPFPTYKKGGIVKRTGLALVHKGERVTPASKSRKTTRKSSRRK